MFISKRVCPAIRERLEALDNAGFQVQVSHERGLNYDEDVSSVPFQAVTILSIETAEFGVLEGYAFCSVFDQFDKAKGVEVAFRHLMKVLNAHFGRDQLVEFFNEVS